MKLPIASLFFASATLIQGCSGAGPVSPVPPGVDSSPVVTAPQSTYFIGDVQFDGPLAGLRVDIIKDGGSLAATLVDARGRELSVLHTSSMLVIRPGQPTPKRPVVPLCLRSNVLPESPYYPPVGGADEVEVHRMIGDWISQASKVSPPASGGGHGPAGHPEPTQQLQLAKRLHTAIGNRLLLPTVPPGSGQRGPQVAG